MATEKKRNMARDLVKILDRICDPQAGVEARIHFAHDDRVSVEIWIETLNRYGDGHMWDRIGDVDLREYGGISARGHGITLAEEIFGKGRVDFVRDYHENTREALAKFASTVEGERKRREENMRAMETA